MNDRPSVAKKMNRFTASAIISSMYGDDANYDDNDGTHLDSHANMVVCGKYCWVFADSGLKADVTAFSDEVAGKCSMFPLLMH